MMARRVRLCNLAAGAFALLAVEASAGSFCDPDDTWRTDWAEEFDGSTLDTTSWTALDCNEIGSCREAWCSPSNVQVAGGHLILTSKAEQSHGLNYTTGAVNTSSKRSWAGNSTTKYRACISAMLPGGGGNGAGQGIWPAIWMMPDVEGCWPDLGEQDILEMINGDGNAHGTYHWERNYPLKNCTQPSGHLSTTNAMAMKGWDTAFHEYAIERADTYLAFVYDGKTLLNITGGDRATNTTQPKLWDVPFYLILNTAVGGPWPGPTNASTVFPTTHTIDYVRVVVADA